VRRLTAKGVQVDFVKEQLSFTGEDNAMGALLRSVNGCLRRVRALLDPRTPTRGASSWLVAGVPTGARRRSSNDEQAAELRQKAQAGVPKAALAREFGISRETLYQNLRADPLNAPAPVAVSPPSADISPGGTYGAPSDARPL
jgi:hypothetical protein